MRTCYIIVNVRSLPIDSFVTIVFHLIFSEKLFISCIHALLPMKNQNNNKQTHIVSQLVAIFKIGMCELVKGYPIATNIHTIYLVHQMFPFCFDVWAELTRDWFDVCTFFSSFPRCFMSVIRFCRCSCVSFFFVLLFFDMLSGRSQRRLVVHRNAHAATWSENCKQK